MSTDMFPRDPLRDALDSALPRETALFEREPPDVRFLYMPISHARALQMDGILVEGMRGAGKSLWWAALQSELHRKAVARYLPDIGITASTNVSPGFGEGPDPDDYPQKDALKRLAERYNPRDIWRMIIARHVFRGKAAIPDSWDGSVKWLLEDPDRSERMFFDADQELQSNGKKHLILFDALDRTADDWDSLCKLLKGLLQVLLEFRSFRAIRAKAFLRPDMLEDERVLAFPDASKIITNKVELTWSRVELYSLLWQYLGNAGKGGDVFRKYCNKFFNQKWKSRGNVWLIPEAMCMEEQLQRNIFHAITGPQMGRDHRRGYPYTWLPNHLGDAQSRTSPRSFLAALRKAVADKLRSDQKFALHYEAIKKGVQESSSIRVLEMKEDYPWVFTAMEPLGGVIVPCNFNEIERCWIRDRTLKKLHAPNKGGKVQLTPSRVDQEGASGLRKALERLGVLHTMKDGRINMPDVYRIGFRLKRRGGVKPVR